MVTNNILIPYNLLGKLKSADTISSKSILNSRKIGIFLLIILSYFIYRYFGLDYNLVSIGMIAFVVISQLAPAFFGALFWRRGSRLGAIYSVLTGFVVCLFTLLIPYSVGITNSKSTFVSNGYFNIELLKTISIIWLRLFRSNSTCFILEFIIQFSDIFCSFS